MTAIPYRVRRAITSTAISRPGVAVAGRLTRSRVRCQGLEFDTRHPGYTPLARTLLLWGIYERAEIRFIRRYLRTSNVVVELGAGIGVTSAHILNTIPPDARLLSVEGDPRVFEALRANVQRHERGQDVRLVNARITDGSVEGSPEGEIIEDDLWNIEDRTALGRARTKDAISLRSLLSSQDLDEYALVSDIEGAEADFILAPSDSSPLRSCLTAVFELHETVVAGQAVAVDELIDRLDREHGLAVRARHNDVVAVARPD